MEGNSFCENSKHIIWNEKELQNNIERTSFNRSNFTSKKANSKMNAYLSNFSQALYWVCNCCFREVHGPYEVKFRGENLKLLVRDYFKLNQGKLYKTKIDYQKIRSLCLYERNIKFNFVVLNDYYWKGNLNDALRYWKVYGNKNGNKESLNEGDIRSFIGTLMSENRKVTSKVSELTEKEKIIALMKRFYLTLNYFQDILGFESSKFPKEKVENLIRNKTLKGNSEKVEPKKLFDPRLK